MVLVKPRREKPIPEDEWRALAAQNPMRVTYPSWKPKSYWDAKDKADPWKVAAATTDWRKADARRATFAKVVVGWMWPAVKVGPGSGFIQPPPPPVQRRRNW